jgi:hypothetical protein
VRDDGADMGLEDRVAPGVVAVVVGVDQQVDRPRRLGLDAVEALLRGVGKLRVHDDDPVGRHQPPDGAAARGEDADVVAQRRERAVHRRRLALRPEAPGRQRHAGRREHG